MAEISELCHIRFGSGENIILLHGWGGNKNSLLGIAEALSFEYTVTAVDLYGFGDTPHPPYPIGLTDFADGVFNLVQKYNMSKVTFIGHSFGGKVALCFALKYPNFVNKVVLIDSSGMRPRRKPTFFIKKFINKIYIMRGVKPPFASADYLSSSGAMRKSFVKVVNTHLDGKVNSLQAKTLLIWGKKDKETPMYMAKRLHKKIKNSSLLALDGAGHFSYMENPTVVINAIKEFLGEA